MLSRSSATGAWQAEGLTQRAVDDLHARKVRYRLSGSPALASQPTTKSSALLLELYGGFVRRLGGWMASVHLVQLLAELGVDAPTSRAAMARLTHQGLLQRELHGSPPLVGYALSEQAKRILTEGDRRILQRRPITDMRDGWVLVVFSIPERQRHVRHVLRSRLVRLGFGNAASGVWIAPRWLLEDARGLVERLGLSRQVQVYVAQYRGLDDLAQIVGRAWDLRGLSDLYAQFIAEYAPVLRQLAACGRIEPAAAFVAYMQAQSRWRALPLLDPGLPPEFLPPNWQGAAAADLFFALRELLDQPAMQYVRAISRA